MEHWNDIVYSPDGELKVSADYLIRNPRGCSPHVVILGAGASIQAFPDGDNNGVALPVMNNLIDLVNLKDLLNKCKIDHSENNFEVIYSQLSTNPDYRDCLLEVENRVHSYFVRMQLPDTPTLYDHLLLSLRKQDIVATFNWDPFLFDSWERLDSRFGSAYLPQLAFLHGNVRVGHCAKHHVFGRNGRYCPDCDQVLSPTPILFPIEIKNYESNPFISEAWQRLLEALGIALGVTIFGYGAPASDRAAISLMKAAWNRASEREVETIFLVDTKSESELLEKWRPFIYSHHYTIEKDFYQSQLPRTARRSIEALHARTIEGRFVESCPVPRAHSWEQLHNWFREAVKYEPKS